VFQSTRQQSGRDSSSAVDIAPLIDIVFILLIFFLVTTTFVQQKGLDLEQPRASQASTVSPQALRISISGSGNLYAKGQSLSVGQLRQRVQQYVQGEPEGAVVVVPDRRVPAGRLVEVMNTAKAAGAKDIAVAAKQEGGG
jgi:biopolymer transport protein ExbD